VKHIFVQIDSQNWKLPYSTHPKISHYSTPNIHCKFVTLDGIHNLVEIKDLLLGGS